MSQDARPDAPPWTILRLLEWTRKFFESKGIDDARLEAELLLAHALQLERLQLYMQHNRVVAEPQLSAFRDLVKRRAQRVPTQYLLGEAYFRHLTLKVTPAVLVPRPETEILVDEALELICPKKRPAWKFERGEFIDHRAETAQPELLATSDGPAPPPAPRVLDLCTGSGCIAAAFAANLKSATVLATDISPAACEVARANIERLGLADRVVIACGDLWEPLSRLTDPRPLDLILSNPPYIPSGRIESLDRSVRDFEPRLALDGGADGLDIHRRILADLPARLRPGGLAFLEIQFDQGEQVLALAGAVEGLEEPRVVRDFAGNDRVLKVRRA